jgi:hypothetical protein
VVLLALAIGAIIGFAVRSYLTIDPVSPLGVAWIGVGVAIFAAGGVGYLLYQGVLDRTPRLSYRIQHSLGTSSVLVGTKTHHTVMLNFTIENRTSRDATFQCTLSIPLERTPTRSSWRSLSSVGMTDAGSSASINMGSFSVTARNGRELAIQGNIPEDLTDPEVLELTIRDDRIGDRRWVYQTDVPVGSFPSLPSAADMFKALRPKS